MPSAMQMRGLRIPDALYLKLRKIASVERRSFNQEATFILAKYVEEYEADHGEILIDEDVLYE